VRTWTLDFRRKLLLIQPANDDADVLRALASAVGKPVNVDLNAPLATQGQFTRNLLLDCGL
jgi:hypothetical protein